MIRMQQIAISVQYQLLNVSNFILLFFFVFFLIVFFFFSAKDPLSIINNPIYSFFFILKYLKILLKVTCKMPTFITIIF